MATYFMYKRPSVTKNTTNDMDCSRVSGGGGSSRSKHGAQVKRRKVGSSNANATPTPSSTTVSDSTATLTSTKDNSKNSNANDENHGYSTSLHTTTTSTAQMSKEKKKTKEKNKKSRKVKDNSTELVTKKRKEQTLDFLDMSTNEVTQDPQSKRLLDTNSDSSKLLTKRANKQKLQTNSEEVQEAQQHVPPVTMEKSTDMIDLTYGGSDTDNNMDDSDDEDSIEVYVLSSQKDSGRSMMNNERIDPLDRSSIYAPTAATAAKSTTNIIVHDLVSDDSDDDNYNNDNDCDNNDNDSDKNDNYSDKNDNDSDKIDSKNCNLFDDQNGFNTPHKNVTPLRTATTITPTTTTENNLDPSIACASAAAVGTGTLNYEGDGNSGSSVSGSACHGVDVNSSPRSHSVSIQRCVPSTTPLLEKQQQQHRQQHQDGTVFRLGDPVRVTGLTSRIELNGIIATYIGFIDKQESTHYVKRHVNDDSIQSSYSNTFRRLHKVRLFNSSKEVIYLSKSNIIGITQLSLSPCTARQKSPASVSAVFRDNTKLRPAVSTSARSFQSSNSPFPTKIPIHEKDNKKNNSYNANNSKAIHSDQQITTLVATTKDIASSFVSASTSMVTSNTSLDKSVINSTQLIPSTRVHEFIGQNNSAIERLCIQTGTHIELKSNKTTSSHIRPYQTHLHQKKQQQPEYHRVFVTGLYQNVMAAIALIEKFVQSEPNPSKSFEKQVHHQNPTSFCDRYDRRSNCFEKTNKDYWHDHQQEPTKRLSNNDSSTGQNLNKRIELRQLQKQILQQQHELEQLQKQLHKNNPLQEPPITMDNQTPSKKSKSIQPIATNPTKPIQAATALSSTSNSCRFLSAQGNNSSHMRGNDSTKNSPGKIAHNPLRTFVTNQCQRDCFKCTGLEFYNWLQMEGIVSLNDLIEALNVTTYVKSQMQTVGLKAFKVDYLREAAIEQLKKSSS